MTTRSSARTQLTVAILSLAVAAASFGWSVYRGSAGTSSVLITFGRAPATNTELVMVDGAQFSPDSRSGLVSVPRAYVGTLVFVRDQSSHREVARFILRSGLNEISL